jgi:hypothetical protein
MGGLAMIEVDLPAEKPSTGRLVSSASCRLSKSVPELFAMLAGDSEVKDGQRARAWQRDLIPPTSPRDLHRPGFDFLAQSSLTLPHCLAKLPCVGSVRLEILFLPLEQDGSPRRRRRAVGTLA